MLDLLTDSYAIVSTATLGYMLWSKRLVRNKDKAILPGKKLKKIDAPPFDFVKDWNKQWLELNGVSSENHKRVQTDSYSSDFWECSCGKAGYYSGYYQADSFAYHKMEEEKPMRELLDFDTLILKKEKEREQEQKALAAKPWFVPERDMVTALENKAKTEENAELADLYQATLNIITGATFHTSEPVTGASYSYELLDD